MVGGSPFGGTALHRLPLKFAGLVCFRTGSTRLEGAVGFSWSIASDLRRVNGRDIIIVTCEANLFLSACVTSPGRLGSLALVTSLRCLPIVR